MSEPHRIINKLIENLAWSVFSFLGFAVFSLWLLYKDSIVIRVVADIPNSIYSVGWIMAILTVVTALSIASAIYLWRLRKDPFKGFTMDQETQTCIDNKTAIHYCPSCLGDNRKSPMLHEDNYWRCSNADCKNSRMRPVGTQQ